MRLFPQLERDPEEKYAKREKCSGGVGEARPVLVKSALFCPVNGFWKGIGAGQLLMAQAQLLHKP